MRGARSSLPVQHRGVRQWWLDRSVRTKGMIVVTVPLFILILIVLASVVLQNNERQERAVSIAASTLSSSADQILSDALNAETGIRGYVATGDPAFLAPYNTVLGRISEDTTTLRSAATAEGDRRAEQAIEASLNTAMAQFGHMRAAVGAGTSASTLRQELLTGKNTVDTLRARVDNLAARPSAIVAAHRTDITRMESQIGVLTIAGVIIGLVSGFFGIVLVTSGISRRVVAIAANADRMGRGQPMEPLPAARDELGRLSDALGHAERLLDTRATELISARDQALRATASKNAFLSSTSHELRTPLNAILGFTQLLQLSDHLGEEDRDGVERILGAGRHLLALINELIDIARIESGELSLSVEPVLVRPLVEESCQLMAALAAERSITVNLCAPEPGLAVRADQQRLRQILVNLLSNAIKYNRRGGTISIGCRAEGDDQVKLVVKDAGPGIPAADLERIFIPFERLGAEQTGIEGTGIGLPLARALAHAMGGQLTASSVPGKGSAFSVVLPSAVMPWSHDRVEVPRQAAIPPRDPAVAAIKVLYIEDNPANIEVVSRFLKARTNVVLRTAMTGEAGLEAAVDDVPDLILLDLHLPDLLGEEVLGHLRADPATAEVPVAVLSAEAAPTVIRRLRASGIVAYLTKPLDLADVSRLIQSLSTSERRSDAIPGATSR
jgi:signal transduction histidine kinase/ActR/RegA family two-component response regulator